MPDEQTMEPREILARAWFERNMASLDCWDDPGWREERLHALYDVDVQLAALQAAGYVVVKKNAIQGGPVVVMGIIFINRNGVLWASDNGGMTWGQAVMIEENDTKPLLVQDRSAAQ
jgi:hypothetical protein